MDVCEADFEELKPLHEKLEEILAYIDEFCTMHQIQEWCLAYGSALGAKRHGGPIPWDDDADIYMTKAAYEKFRDCFQKSGDHDRFYLQEFSPVNGMVIAPKFRMNGTTFVEETCRNKDMHQGIYIDIFLLHEAPPNAFQRMKSVAAINYYTLKKLSNTNYKKRKSVQWLLAFLRLFPEDFGCKMVLRNIYRWDSMSENKKSEYFADWELYNGTKKWFIPKKDLFPVQRAAYGKRMLPIPGNIEEYLKQCYGAWEQIPHIDKIKWAQHAAEWSATRDFREVLPNIHSFADEKNI